MNKSKILYVFLVILSFCGVAFSQQGNPFEIKTRQKTENAQIESQEKNVFNINPSIENTQQKFDIDTTNPFELNKKSIGLKEIESHESIELSEIDNSKSLQLNHLKSNSGNSSFLLWIFLFILVLIAILLSFNRRLILKIFKTVWYYNLTTSLFRNFGNRDLLFYILLFINFIVNLSVFIYLYINKYHQLGGLQFLMNVAGVILLIYSIKHLLILVFNHVFTSLKSINIYNFTILLFNISLGILLIPLNLVIAYSISAIAMFFIYFTVLSIILFYILRLFRGFLTTYNYFNISIIHFFLYLCAFEIVPLLFLYRFFINYL